METALRGRNHLADYSGEYKADLLLNAFQIGAKYQRYIFSFNKFDVGYQLNAGLILTDFYLDEILIIYDEEIVNSGISLDNTGLFIEPMAKASYNLFESVNINLSTGYNFNLKSDLEFYRLQTGVYTNWSGLRFQIGIDYSFDFSAR
ncbi:hypothetical protein [Chondrinema litorale]|uniref:hypothetical protein n=1 Tax=Chondrinema litorale TaxID=2994555 RepID=UPI00254285D3|nr:hypothetical protein [Chondrinema litorale]UZR99763.1 hypothetical protein OQ292_37815 [Chondrinema litorale]